MVHNHLYIEGGISLKLQWSMMVIVLILFVTLISACSGQDYDNLTRIDVQKSTPEGNYEDATIITEEETITELKRIFQQINWDPSIQPSMSRIEDVWVTLFYTIEEDMPERLYEYRIWFESDSHATIISDKEDEGYGFLNKEDTAILKDILMN